MTILGHIRDGREVARCVALLVLLSLLISEGPQNVLASWAHVAEFATPGISEADGRNGGEDAAFMLTPLPDLQLTNEGAKPNEVALRLPGSVASVLAAFAILLFITSLPTVAPQTSSSGHRMCRLLCTFRL